ncbi:Glycoside hydrolase family 61 [Penicillium brevicompactum]|uniref:lytic cellulose monooxygenase (C4-dehydrogenating) n=1 Tax=Penicillium brevicompactum TaxID=5074 RepID=A0A9W9QBC6_PENBR|nr:Glycoside hydrolase family 61 [Penicillium brevicompactum]
MKNFAFLVGAALAAIPHASAHYFFPHFIADGNFTGYFEYVREDTQGYMPYKGGYSSDDLRCNTGSMDYASKTGVYKVKAGETIGFGTDFNALIGHPGPLQVYMSKAPGDVREYDGSGDWFKIYELGPKSFSSDDGITWGVNNIGNFTFQLPNEIPAGQYLVRIEQIALHGAGEWGGAELYFNCAQIEVESDSIATPGPLVKIPGVYDGYEPGILFYMYRDYIVNYTMPGPVPYPIAALPNVTASGLSVAPTTAWSAPAVTNYASSSATVQPSSAVQSSSIVSRSKTVTFDSSATSTPFIRGTSTLSSTSSQTTEASANTATISPVSNLDLAQFVSGDDSMTGPSTAVSVDVESTCGLTKTVTVKTTVTVSSATREPTCAAATLTTTTTTTTTILAKATEQV